MVKISAKLIKNHRTIKSITYSNVNDYNSDDFYSYLVEICRRLDVATPLLIPLYVKNYEEFNFIRFLKDDFIDQTNFDYLLLENIDR